MSSLGRTKDKILARMGPRANLWPRLRARASGGRPFAYHGIQRSGTNYCLKSLRALGTLPVNMFDGARNAPTHKHFRWQPDKTSITLEPRFANRLTAGTLAELNRTAGYPEGTRHLVMQKRIDGWAVSIVNWGLFCRWWPDVETALADRQRIFEEYHHYNTFWHGMAAQAPDDVAILDLNTVLDSKGQALVSALDRLGVAAHAGLHEKQRALVVERVQDEDEHRKHGKNRQKEDTHENVEASLRGPENPGPGKAAFLVGQSGGNCRLIQSPNVKHIAPKRYNVRLNAAPAQSHLLISDVG
ncbi:MULTISPECIES: hypothetical protein [Mameliella]|uniref:hypothetical protein n=1 Tax=Mameliella TaxID=1434019 RepID=UPI000B531478|nr:MULTISPECIES: hypothetical protein [Mameliella]MCR9272263.1 hypothetical protein [Paracoccaceae bacterium]OWV61700.1 hypothetical protein CDZ98_04135 [Mameliella alba]